MRYRITAVLDDGSKRDASVPANPRTTLGIARGEDVPLDFTVVYPDGRRVDLSPVGTTLITTVKRRPDEGTSVECSLAATITEASNGLASAAFAPADTKPMFPGRYTWDTWLTLSGKRYQVVPTSPFVLLSSVAAVP